MELLTMMTMVVTITITITMMTMITEDSDDRGETHGQALASSLESQLALVASSPAGMHHAIHCILYFAVFCILQYFAFLNELHTHL